MLKHRKCHLVKSVLRQEKPLTVKGSFGNAPNIARGMNSLIVRVLKHAFPPKQNIKPDTIVICNSLLKILFGV